MDKIAMEEAGGDAGCTDGVGAGTTPPLLLMKLCHLVPCPAKAMVKQLSNNQSMFFGITLWMEIMVCIYMCKAQRGVKPKLLLLRPKLYLKHTPII